MKLGRLVSPSRPVPGSRLHDPHRRGRRARAAGGLLGPPLAHRRTSARRLGDLRGRRPGPAGDVLLRRGRRRRLQDHRRRADLEPAVRAREGVVDRRARPGAERSEGDLRRHRPGHQPLGHRRRRRRLPLRRRRPDLGGPRPRRQPPHRPPVDRSAQRRRGARRRPGALLRPQPRARRLPQHGRRQELGEGAVRERRHRRRRPLRRSERARHDLRRDLAGPLLPLALLLHPRRRTGERHLQVDRRRQELDAPDRPWPPRRPDGPHRARRRPRQPGQRGSTPPSTPAPSPASTARTTAAAPGAG